MLLADFTIGRLLANSLVRGILLWPEVVKSKPLINASPTFVSKTGEQTRERKLTESGAFLTSIRRT